MIPWVQSPDDAVAVYHEIYTRDEEEQYGVILLELR